MARYRVRQTEPCIYVVEQEKVAVTVLGAGMDFDPITYWDEIWTAHFEEDAIAYAKAQIAKDAFKPRVVWESE